MTAGYYKLTPQEIFNDVVKSEDSQIIHLKGIDFLVHPHVYPSNKFRTTNFLLENLEPLFKNAHVCDMGCGFGVVGIYALNRGAKSVVQADINLMAVDNANENKKNHSFQDDKLQVYLSNCFENIPEQKFDLIVFNIPFHSEPYQISDPLEFAFHDPLFRSLRNFLQQAFSYCHKETKVIIAFSNKGNVLELENIFTESSFNWTLWKTKNRNRKFDNRLYLLTIKNNFN